MYIIVYTIIYNDIIHIIYILKLYYNYIIYPKLYIKHISLYKNMYLNIHKLYKNMKIIAFFMIFILFKKKVSFTLILTFFTLFFKKNAKNSRFFRDPKTGPKPRGGSIKAPAPLGVDIRGSDPFSP